MRGKERKGDEKEAEEEEISMANSSPPYLTDSDWIPSLTISYQS